MAAAADDDNDAVLFEKIKKGNYDADDPIWESISPEAKDVVAKLLTVDSAQRLTAEEALAHAWVQGLTPTTVDEGKRRTARAAVVGGLCGHGLAGGVGGARAEGRLVVMEEKAGCVRLCRCAAARPAASNKQLAAAMDKMKNMAVKRSSMRKSFIGEPAKAGAAPPAPVEEKEAEGDLSQFL